MQSHSFRCLTTRSPSNAPAHEEATMTGYSADPGQIDNEGKRWFDVAEDMAGIRQSASGLGLGITALIVKSGSYLHAHRGGVQRLQGAGIEFELIGVALRNIAVSYEEQEQVTGDSFRVTQEELEQVSGADRPGAGGRGSDLIV